MSDCNASAGPAHATIPVSEVRRSRHRSGRNGWNDRLRCDQRHFITADSVIFIILPSLESTSRARPKAPERRLQRLGAVAAARDPRRKCDRSIPGLGRVLRRSLRAKVRAELSYFFLCSTIIVWSVLGLVLNSLGRSSGGPTQNLRSSPDNS
jgi:hypothetical protein